MTKEAEAVDALECIFGNMAKLVINVEGWVSRGYSETATKAMREAMEDGWTQIGWKPYLDAQRAAKLALEHQSVRQDAEFAITYRDAFGTMDYERMARVLSERLRQMDLRAKAANARAYAAERQLAAVKGVALAPKPKVEERV